jgi:hypothetical protein
MTMKIETITQDNDGFWYALASRDGQYLPSINGKHYDTEKKALRGAKLMIKKAC